MLPHLSPATAHGLRTALDRCRHTTDGVRELLGPGPLAALRRGETEPAFRATAEGGELGVLVRLLLGSVEPGRAVTAALVAALPDHLEPGGVAQLLGSWLHVEGQEWPDRIRSWLPDGIDAWIVQREVADPALHVGTWQRDAGLDPAVPAARARGPRVRPARVVTARVKSGRGR